jgi:hypothetical protein
MEPRFGHDFGHVRVHADTAAADSARAVHALAYTVGHHVVMGAGRYLPHSNPGRKLLAHELTHVVQQATFFGGAAPATFVVGDPAASARAVDALAYTVGHDVVPDAGEFRPGSTPTSHMHSFDGGQQSPLQPKLVVGHSDDPLEREAGRIADTVVAGGHTVRTVSPQAAAMVQRTCAGCDEVEAVQGKDAASPGLVEPNVTSSILASEGSGRPLSTSERSFFEPRFGHHFDDVRVHDGEQAAKLSAHVAARAFTHGQDIFLGHGHYSPENLDGRRLMAHELTHTLQQRHGGSSSQLIQRQETPKQSVPRSCPTSAVRKTFSRGNDDPGECQYETASIRVEVFADPCVCGRILGPAVPMTMEYVATLAGKSFSDPARTIPETQASRIGSQASLAETTGGSASTPLVHRTAGPPGDPGDTLSARLSLTPRARCDGTSVGGTVTVGIPTTATEEGVTFQTIAWSVSAAATGVAKADVSLTEAPPAKGRVATPTRVSPRYPTFPGTARDTDNCQCHPVTGQQVSRPGRTCIPRGGASFGRGR